MQLRRFGRGLCSLLAAMLYLPGLKWFVPIVCVLSVCVLIGQHETRDDPWRLLAEVGSCRSKNHALALETHPSTYLL